MVERKILLTPGPATTSDSLKLSQVVPDICPRVKDFGNLMLQISQDLVKIAGGDESYACVLFGGSGTAGMESVVSSALKGKALIINNGAYGERFVQIAEAYSIPHKELFFYWREKVDLKRIEKELAQDKSISEIILVHHETTTGILNPIKQIGELSKKFNCSFIVDAISSFAGVPFNAKDCNIDFMISTSNKCLQGLPGVCFIICKKEALEKTKEYPRKSFYLNLYDQYAFFLKNNQTRFTPPVQTIYALDKAISEFLEEGAENRYRRYSENNKILTEGMQGLGFTKIETASEESGLLTTFYIPDHVDFNEMHDSLYSKGFSIYPGKIKENTFRLASIGALNQGDIKNFLEALKTTLEESANFN